MLREHHFLLRTSKKLLFQKCVLKLQKVNRDQSQEEEIISKDVWGSGERKICVARLFLHRNFVVCTKPGIIVGAEVGAGNSNTQPICDATLVLLFGSEVTYVMLIHVKFDRGRRE